jgi:hypothetical protein
MNIEKTETITLNEVILSYQSAQLLLSSGDKLYSHSRPDEGSCRNGLVVGIGIKDLVRTRIEAVVGSNLPQGRPVGIRVSDAEED